MIALLSLLITVVAPPPPPCDEKCKMIEAASSPEQHGFSVAGVTSKGNSDYWLSEDDNPTGEHGTTVVNFDVTEVGRASNCRVIRSSGHPRLDEITCTILLRRARFEISSADRLPRIGAYKHEW